MLNVLRPAGGAAAVAALLSCALPFASSAILGEDPLDPMLTQCLGPAGDPEPGTPEFALRDTRNMYCAEQRNADLLQHPINFQRQLELYGADPYREPHRHDDVRFRHDALSVAGAAADVFRPCDATSCANLPAELARFEPPYPVVIALHGFASDKDHLWWATQPLAESGYFVVAVNGTGSELPGALLDWLHGEAQTLYPGELDLDRVGITGHSLGAENSTRTQGDPRVSAIIGWDPCNSPAGCANSPGSRLHDRGEAAQTPTLIIAADYSGFPGYPQPRFSVPGTLRAEAFEILRGNGVDTMLITPRATTHLDWAGSFTFGSRYNEATSNHYGMAWFDRYLKGRLVVDENGDVVTTGGRSAEEERAHRQALAAQAFARLTATAFDGTVDQHNISQGYYDAAQAAQSGDPLLGGNVPYRFAGLPLADRLSFYHPSVCFVSIPDYRAGAADPVLTRADTGLDGDMRMQGCPVTQTTADSDGDGLNDLDDACPQQFAQTADGCPAVSDPDSDGDGVPDSADQCPGTNAGLPVDARGCEAASGELSVSLTADPAQADVTQGAQTVTFTATPEIGDAERSGTVRYVYYFGDGSRSEQTTDTQVQHSYDQAGEYTATVVASDDNQNSATDSVPVRMTTTVTVSDPPPGPIEAQLDVQTNSDTAPVTATLDASASRNVPEGALYTFDFGDGGATRTTTNPVVVRVYSLPGDYTLRVTVTDPEDATRSSEATNTLSVAAPQQTTAAFTLSPSDAVVGQTEVQFDASGSVAAPGRSIDTYVFDFYGDGSVTQIQAEATAVFVYQRAGRFQPRVTVIDDANTQSTAKSDLVVRASPAAPAPGNPDPVTAPGTAGGSGAPGWALLGLLALMARSLRRGVGGLRS